MKSRLIEPLKKIYGSEQAIIDAPYKHQDIDKEYGKRMKGKTRGSTRMDMGLFYSTQEKEEWRAQAKAASLP